MLTTKLIVRFQITKWRKSSKNLRRSFMSTGWLFVSIRW